MSSTQVITLDNIATNPTHIVRPKSVYKSIKDYFWGSGEGAAPSVATGTGADSFKGEGRILGRNPGVDEDTLPTTKAERRDKILAALESRGTYTPNAHDAKPARSCMKGTRVRDDTTKTSPLHFIGTDSPANGKNQHSAHFAGPKSRAPMFDETKARQLLIQNTAQSMGEAAQNIMNPALWTVGASNWTLQDSKGTFDTLGLYGANREDEPAVDHPDHAKWKRERTLFEEHKYITEEEMGDQWPSLRGTGSVFDVIERGGDVRAFLKDNMSMIKNGSQLMPKDADRRTSLYNNPDIMSCPEMQLTKQASTKYRQERPERMKRYISAREQRKIDEQKYDVTTISDQEYASLVDTAIKDLEEYYTSSAATTTPDTATSGTTDTDTATAKTARKTYMDKLGKQKHLLPFQANTLYPATTMGESMMDFFDVIEPRERQFHNLTEKEKWMPGDKGHKLTEESKKMLGTWATQVKAMRNRGQSMVQPLHTYGSTESSTAKAQLDKYHALRHKYDRTYHDEGPSDDTHSAMITDSLAKHIGFRFKNDPFMVPRSKESFATSDATSVATSDASDTSSVSTAA